MATRKKKTSEAAVNDEVMQQAAAEETKQEETKQEETKEVATEEKKEVAAEEETPEVAADEEEETKEVAAGFDKGQTYAAKDVMPLYDKIGGQQIATIYKHDRITVKSTKSASGVVWIETEAGFVAGKDAAGNVYFS